MALSYLNTFEMKLAKGCLDSGGPTVQYWSGIPSPKYLQIDIKDFQQVDVEKHLFSTISTE